MKKTVFLFNLILLIKLNVLAQNPIGDSLKMALNKAKHDTTRCNILNAMIEAEGNDTIWSKYNEKLLKLAEKNINANIFFKKKYLKYLAEANNNIGVLHENQGNIKKALEYYNKSFKILEELEDKNGVAVCLNNIGGVFLTQGDFENALKYYTESYNLHKEIGDKNEIATALSNIGSIYMAQRDFKKAFSYVNSCLKMREEMNDKEGVAISQLNIGNIYKEQGEIKKALYFFDKSLVILEEIDNKMGIAVCLFATAEIYNKQKKYSKAIEFAERSMQVAKDVGYPERIRDASEILYQINKSIGNGLVALKYYEQYIVMKDSITNQENKKAGFKLHLQHEYDKKVTTDSLKTAEEKKIVMIQLKQEKTQRFALTIGLILVFIFAGFMFNRFRVTQQQKNIIELKEKETQQQNLVITQQKHIVEEKHKEITDSINYAERIQRSFLATKEQLNESLNDYFVFFKPKDIVSGDFYWSTKVFKTNGEEDFILVTADSTGHGVPGAIMSLLNITSLEQAVKDGFRNPSDILNATRKTIIERLKKDGSVDGGKDGMDCSLLSFDFRNLKLTISAANNPVWIVRNSDISQAQEIIEIKPDKMPVGKHEKDQISFTQQEIQLKKRDIVFTLTDGFSDQFGGENGKKFMSKNLRGLLANNSRLSMPEQLQLLEKTFVSWKQDIEQVDDVTLIGIRV